MSDQTMKTDGDKLIITIRNLTSPKISVKLYYIMIGFFLLILVAFSIVNWDAGSVTFGREMLISDFTQIFYSIGSIAMSYFLYFLFLRIMILFNKTAAENRPNLFGTTIDQLSQLFIIPVFFSDIVSDIAKDWWNLTNTQTMSIQIILISFLLFHLISSVIAEKNAYIETIIDKTKGYAEYTDYYPLLGKKLIAKKIIERNENNNFSVGIAYLVGKKSFRIKIPLKNIHLSAHEFENFYRLFPDQHELTTFTLVLMHGDIKNDDLEPNDPRYKGKIFGSALGSYDIYEEVVQFLEGLREYIPIEIVRPLKYASKFGGYMQQQFTEEPHRTI